VRRIVIVGGEELGIHVALLHNHIIGQLPIPGMGLELSRVGVEIANMLEFSEISVE